MYVTILGWAFCLFLFLSLIEILISFRVKRSLIYARFASSRDYGRVFLMARKDLSLRWITANQKAGLYFFLVTLSDELNNEKVKLLKKEIDDHLSENKKLGKHPEFLMSAAVFYYTLVRRNIKESHHHTLLSWLDQAEDYYTKSGLSLVSRNGFIGFLYKFNALLDMEQSYKILDIFKGEIGGNLDVFKKKKRSILLFYKGMALMKSNQWGKAAVIFHQEKKHFSHHQREDLYYLYHIEKRLGQFYENKTQIHQALDHYQTACHHLEKITSSPKEAQKDIIESFERVRSKLKL